MFVEAKDGYANDEWWQYPREAQLWRKENPKPKASVSQEENLPRTHVSWYEGVAFCLWLGSKARDKKIMLPSEQQWQRAAQGDDGRNYPWGNTFDATRCNFNSTGITSVTRYWNGESPFKVWDMCGNVWEWCLTEYESGKPLLPSDNIRVLRGGSWWSNHSDLLRTTIRSRNFPGSRDNEIGFRIARTP